MHSIENKINNFIHIVLDLYQNNSILFKLAQIINTKVLDIAAMKAQASDYIYG